MGDSAGNSTDASAYKQPLQLREVATLRGHTDEIGHLRFSPDATRLLALPRTGKAKLWDIWRQKPVDYLDTNHDDTSSYAFSPDSEVLAIGGKDGMVRLWTRDGELLTALPRQTFLVTRLAFSSDGGVLITGDATGCIRLWNWAAEQVIDTAIPEAELIKTFTSSAGLSTTADRFVSSSDSRYLATVLRSDRSAIQIYETSTLTRILMIQASSSNHLRDMTFSPDSRFLAVANSSGRASGWKGLIQIWDIASRNCVTSVAAFPDPGYAQFWQICSIDWAQNNSLIATGGWDATGKGGDFEDAMVIKLWEVQET